MANIDAVTAYFRHVKARDLDGLKALFTADASFTLPNGRTIEGLGDIADMYSGMFAAQPPAPSPIAMAVGADCIATEIEAALPDGTMRRTANFFHFGADGLLVRVSVYARSA